MDSKEMMGRAKALYAEARTILENPEATAEDIEKVEKMHAEANALKERALRLQEIAQQAATIGDLDAEAERKEAGSPEGPQFKHMGQWLQAVAQAGDIRYRGPLHPSLKRWADPEEPQGYPANGSGWVTGKEEKATMVENVGSRGGFLVSPEYRAELLGVEAEPNFVRQRATIIPIPRRQVNIPTVDQTGTTSGQPHFFGGMIGYWPEEAAEKTQSDPTFRQVQLTAHKFVGFTRASDELLEDEGIGLAAFLSGPMGFRGLVNWYEEYAFLRGTGVGQPLGVVNAGATISVARQATNPPVSLTDLASMMESFLMTGGQGVWVISQTLMSDIITMSGPTGNASYIWLPSARDGIPNTLLGMPVIWTEKLPTAGNAGDVLLANWRYYLIGDRKRTTIESTNHRYFEYDQTAWRVVHRVEGKPWLSAPITLQDGTAQISPFVILGAKST